MAKLLLLRGYPGSGKTTHARRWVAQDPSRRVRVNRDDIRHSMYGKYSGLTFEQEKAVTVSEHAQVRAFLKARYHVVVDATNLKLKFARAFADIAVEMGADFEVVNVETSAQDCILHDIAREDRGDRFVGRDVILGFAKRYPMPWRAVEPTPRSAETPPAFYEPDRSLPEAVIVDLDGTLAHNVTGREMWGEGLKRVYEDMVDLNVARFIWAQSARSEIIFMSGRNESARSETERWLRDEALLYRYHLLMRADGDMRPDYIVKAELFDKHVRDHYNVRMALDDRDQIVNLWRGMGIPTWQVAPGSF